jgi:uncharacterized protein YcbK (DUF882 family)
VSRRLPVASLVFVSVIAVWALATADRLTAAFGDTRTLTLFNIHTKETVTVLYKKDGRWVSGAKDKLDWAVRDWRRNEKTAMDPELYDLLWEMHTELGSREAIHVISGFRSRNTNDTLRATSGGQAKESQHIQGKAMDVHFPDVPTARLRYSALIRERGGVGYYPTSAIPFVHIDTAGVRAWPRLPRMELALLFPNGQTRHLPAEGGPITSADAQLAQTQKKQLAQEVAAYHDFRRQPKTPFALADAAAAGLRPSDGTGPARPQKPPVAVAIAMPAARVPTPQLIEQPAPVERSSRLAQASLTQPSGADRAKLNALMQLAAVDPAPRLVQAPQAAVRPPLKPSLTGNDVVATPPPPPKPAARVAAVTPPASSPIASLIDAGGWGNGFAVAPAFDEEHPDELSYRPFPIAPYMTASASADDPALATLTHPDVSKTLEMIDQAGTVLPMRLRPTGQQAAMLFAQQFRGDAVIAMPSSDGVSPLTNRKVSTR